MAKEALITWEELATHTEPTDLWVAISGSAYNVTSWLRLHPGGERVLLHHGGRDATEAFLAFHRPKSHVHTMMRAYLVGRMESESRTPLSAGNKAFRKLAQQVEAAGLYNTPYACYAYIAIWAACLMAAAVWLAVHGHPVAAAFVVALFNQQVAFVGHDAGHHAITHKGRLDTAIGLLVNACVGIGLSWWCDTHNTHHTVVNSADCDPDIQFMPLIANSPLYFKSLFSKYHKHELPFDAAAKRLIPWQHFTFLPLLSIARYGMYIQAFKQLMYIKAFWNKWLELAAQLAFFTGYGFLVYLHPTAWQRVVFVLVTHAACGVLHLQFCLSHFTCHVYEGLPPEGEWLAAQVSGTMNWSCPRWLDWLHGGLQYQIEHHLFPRLPRHNLGKVAELVKPLCAEVGLRYHNPTFLQAIVELLASLKKTAYEARKLGWSEATK